MNTVLLMGRLTADPTLKTLPSQHTVSHFTIAVDRKYQKDVADFINCVAWNKTAEFIHNYFSKGRMIAVEGELQTRTWDGTDGKRQYATEVNVSDAFFCGSKNQSAQTGDVIGGGVTTPSEDYEGDEFADISDDDISF